ncbi:FERM domain-containing protein 4B [Saguinus oedipus]|uniref:FERM domain-containing protein 4B n=1 Tax=Saguinus oedipus TaxID=9490 RepID=A0ABQ9U3C8_SAGOE|nr:FERM domain-containing protein 4B [Saguinus oedipus]
MASVFMCGVEDLLFSGSRFVWNLTVSTLRRWYTERLRACHQVLRTWCGLQDVYQGPCRMPSTHGKPVPPV